MFRLSTFSMVDNAFDAEPNTNWRLKSCKGLELTARKTEDREEDRNWRPKFSPWAAISASLFARANVWELAFQIWKLSSLVQNVARATISFSRGSSRRNQAEIYSILTTQLSRATFCTKRKSTLRNVDRNGMGDSLRTEEWGYYTFSCSSLENILKTYKKHRKTENIRKS